MEQTDQNFGREGEVRVLEETRRKGLIDLDLVTLRRIFARDLVHVHTNGLVHDRDELLAHIQQRKQFVDVKRPNLVVRIYGDMAVLTGPLINVMRDPSGGPDREMFAVATQVASKTADGWQFVSFQASLRQ